MRQWLKRTCALSDSGIRNFYKGVASTVVVNLAIMASMGLVYLLMGSLMESFLSGGAAPSVLPYLAGSLAFFVISVILHRIQYTNTYGLVYDEICDIRIRLAERLRQLPMSFFGDHDLADLVETVMGDVDKLEHVWSHVLPYFFGSLISTLIVFVMTFLFNPILSLAAFWSVPVAFLLLFGSRRSTRSVQQAARDASIAVSDNIQEMLDCVREIRATNQQDAYLARLGTKIDGFESTNIRAELTGGIFMNSAAIILRLSMATTLLAGAGLIVAGHVDFLTFFMFMLLISRIYAPFDQSLALIYELLALPVSTKRLNRFFDEPLATGSEDFAPSDHDITFDRVAFRYDEGAGSVLDEVSFVAKEGEVTALVGPSGSGKSTCARLSARLWDASAGTVRVGGIDISAIDPETLYGQYAVVFQDVMLFDDTVMENIRLGRRGATDEEVLAAARAANCDEFVLRMPEGYATMIGENGAKLSGGERQRISIARAILKDAPIVLLDEATASLDVENETKVQRALSTLLAGKTVLVIAHRMRTVSNVDKVVVLEDGTVSEQGAPAALLEQGGTFARMVALQRESEGWRL